MILMFDGKWLDVNDYCAPSTDKLFQPFLSFWASGGGFAKH